MTANPTITAPPPIDWGKEDWQPISLFELAQKVEEERWEWLAHPGRRGPLIRDASGQLWDFRARPGVALRPHVTKQPMRNDE